MSELLKVAPLGSPEYYSDEVTSALHLIHEWADIAHNRDTPIRWPMLCEELARRFDERTVEEALAMFSNEMQIVEKWGLNNG